MNDSKAIAERYQDKILGIRNYKSAKKEFYISDLTNRDELYDFLWEVSTGESDFSPAGISFMKEYFNLEKLAEEYRQVGRQLPPDGRGKSEAERIKYFIDFINGIKPMEIALFVAQSQWADEEKGEEMPTLKNIDDRLLPPK